MEAFDVESFISEVEARPAIWDSRKEGYLDRDKRSQAWNELCMKFVPDFAKKNVQEKNHAATQMQRRWKSLRDCFKREHTKQVKELKKANSGAVVRKPYKYYQNLSFLISVTETRAEVSSPAVQDEKESSDVAAPVEKKKRKRKKTFVENFVGEGEQELPQELPAQFSLTQVEVDEADRNFALSLLPHFKQISQEYKLDAQMEILMVLKKYKPMGRQPSQFVTTDQEPTPVRSHHPTTLSLFKLSPASTEDGHAYSDDSSINENLYY